MIKLYRFCFFSLVGILILIYSYKLIYLTPDFANEIIEPVPLKGVNLHYDGDYKDIVRISEIGLDVVRTDILWSRVESQKGQYDFKTPKYDELHNYLLENNIRPIYILAYGNRLYEDSMAVNTDKARTAFINYVDEVSKRYSGENVIWEIWNEPNGVYWEPEGNNIEEYSLLVEEASKVINNNDPTGTIIAPALDKVDVKSLDWLKSLMDKGVINNIDAISIHPYSAKIPEQLEEGLIKISEMLEYYTTKDIPIISSEVGYSTGRNWYGLNLTDREQASYLLRMYFFIPTKAFLLVFGIIGKTKGMTKKVESKILVL